MKLKLAALALMAGSSLFAQSYYYGDRYYADRDLRSDYRDLAADQARANQLRADIARDEYQLRLARDYGDYWRARRIQADLNRDRAALNALLRDMRHDRRDIRHDQWERGYR
jgi:hypothetical protein